MTICAHMQFGVRPKTPQDFAKEVAENTLEEQYSLSKALDDYLATWVAERPYEASLEAYKAAVIGPKTYTYPSKEEFESFDTSFNYPYLSEDTKPSDNAADQVTNPKHYKAHPSGVECIQITEHLGFLLGNVIKYVWRADDKGKPLEDLKKARFYLEREITLREAKSKTPT